MSSDVDAIRELAECGCCDGTGLQAPLVVANRPGLSSIAYRPGTHSRFKATMLARLSAGDLPALRGLTTRSDGDFSIALLDAWAAVADIVSFYQERLANEAFLRTATERRSLVELAGLVGYVPRPGVAASVHLGFTIDAGGPPEGVPVPAGTRVQSIPGPGERPQTFETVEAITGHHEHNAMRPVLVQKHPELTREIRVVTVRGVSAHVAKGDSILLLCGAGGSDRVVKRVHSVEVDTVAHTTRIALDEDPPHPPPLKPPKRPRAPWPPPRIKLTTASVQTRILAGSWIQADLKAFARAQRWPIPKLSANIRSQTKRKLRLAPVETGVFAFRQQASVFGHNAPAYSSLPATQRLADYVTGSKGKLVATAPPFPDSWEKRSLLKEPGAETASVDLDSTYPRIVKGSWLVLETAAFRDVYRVEDNTPLSRADFTLSAKVSRVKLSSSAKFGLYPLRQTSVLAQSERLELAELPVLDTVRGDRLVLDGPYLGLTEGRPVVVSGTRVDLDGVSDSEVVTIADVEFDDGHTELVFTTSLAHEYERASVTVNANVALATHGETSQQPLGSGDASLRFQELPLPEAPLTHVAAQTATGASSTLEVRVNELLWREVPFLYGHGADEHVYITRIDAEGTTRVTFGDGVHGAPLPTGVDNVRATYRYGMGADGLVKEGQLTLLQTKPLGVRAVVNPVDAADVADADGSEDLRRNAALPIRTLDRIVSLRDHEDFARAFTGIAKARATWTWNGVERGVFVTVAGVGGKELPEGGLTISNLVAAMRAAGDPLVALRVQSYAPAPFRLAAKIGVDAAYEGAAVLSAVTSAMRRAFSFDAGEFGRPVAKSAVIAVMQAVPGVVAVDLDQLQRTDELGGGTLVDLLTAREPRAGTDAAVAAELLLLDPRPIDLVLMP